MGKLIFLNTQPISSGPWSPALGYWRACVGRYTSIHLCSVYKASLVCLLMCPFTFTICSIHAILNPHIVYEGVPKMNPLSVQTVAFIPRTVSGEVFKSLLMSGWIIKICWSFCSGKTCSLRMAFSTGREISVQELIWPLMAKGCFVPPTWLSSCLFRPTLSDAKHNLHPPNSFSSNSFSCSLSFFFPCTLALHDGVSLLSLSHTNFSVSSLCPELPPSCRLAADICHRFPTRIPTFS